MNRLLEQYKKKIQPQLKKEFMVVNDFAVPRLVKVVVNAGIGRALQANPKALDNLVAGMTGITGQKPVITRAAKAISGFKIRQGQTVGMTATLRGKRMYDFLDKLVNVALPRTRDFRGISRKGFDGRGNYNLGIREHIVFPEVGDESLAGTFGLEITVVTTAKDDEQGYGLLKQFGFPFKD